MVNQYNDYEWVLLTYPEIITKEQLYKICQVSKKTAQHYLENGVIPCVNSGGKTRKYAIRTADVVAFLQARDLDPELYAAPIGWYKQGTATCQPRVHSSAMQKKLISALEIIMEDYPDVLDIRQVMEITGFCHQTILRWCTKKQIESYHIGRLYLIPRVCLMEHLSANRCHAITPTSKEHILNLAQTLMVSAEGSLPETDRV